MKKYRGVLLLLVLLVSATLVFKGESLWMSARSVLKSQNVSSEGGLAATPVEKNVESNLQAQNQRAAEESSESSAEKQIVSSQEEGSGVTDSAAIEPADIEPEKIQEISTDEQVLKNLIQITDRIVEIRKTLQALKSNVKGKSKKEVEDRKGILQYEVSSLVANFESMATRVPEEELPQKSEVNLNWSTAINEISRPMLLAIQEISDKPRRIDLLNARIHNYQNQLERFQLAKHHLDSLSENYREMRKKGEAQHDWPVRAAFTEEIKSLQQKYNPDLIKLKLEETRRSLHEIESSQTSIFEAMAKTVVDFFKVRGRNLLFALLAFFIIWGTLKFGFRFISESTPILKRVRSSQRKVISAFSSILFLAVAAVGGLLCLYLQNDWLLLTLLLLALFGVAWASRQVIPKFISEIRLIMNLGAIREKERVLWHGVPFYIKEIGFFVTLENPALAGGTLHLPVGEFLQSHSRPIVRGEQWFPSECGDWVMLSDGTYGRVVNQTLEQVELDFHGASKFYSTPSFMASHPINFSKGYTHFVRFGLDYAVQGQVTKHWPEVFQAEICSRLQSMREQTGFDKVMVEFDHAADSALMILVKVSFGSGFGGFYYNNLRLIQRLLVELCNKHGLVIPFNQMTLSASPALEASIWGQEGSKNSEVKPVVADPSHREPTLN